MWRGIVWALVVGTLIGSGSFASAAEKPKGWKKLDVKGTVKGTQGGVLYMESAVGDKWIVAVQPENAMDVTFAGTADPTWLQKGMPVKFNGKFNVKMQAQEPIAELTVSAEGTPGVGVVGADAANAFGAGDSPKSNKPAPVDPTAINELTVVGMIKSVTNGKMTVSAGSKTVMCELSPEAKVTVALTGPHAVSVALNGDEIKIEDGWDDGQKHEDGSPKRGVATKLAITSVSPLMGKQPKRPLVKPTENKPAEEKPATEKPATEKPATEKPAAEGAKPAAEAAKPATEEKKADEAKPAAAQAEKAAPKE